MSRTLILALLSAVLVAVAIAAAWPSFRKAGAGRIVRLARIGDPFAVGVFLGTGLLHFLPHAAKGFGGIGAGYPFAFLVAGVVMVALGWIEARGRHDGVAPIVAMGTLSLHSLLAGASLGAQRADAAILVTFIALIAHKGAASFALARLLTNAALARRFALVLMAIFIAALPVGVALGAVVSAAHDSGGPTLPIILALGAGTFLHFGTVHHHFDGRSHGAAIGWPTVAGFALMAVIAAIG